MSYCPTCRRYVNTREIRVLDDQQQLVAVKIVCRECGHVLQVKSNK